MSGAQQKILYRLLGLALNKSLESKFYALTRRVNYAVLTISC